jgi:hypothetical protein
LYELTKTPMKKAIILIVVTAVVAVGAFFFIRNKLKVDEMNEKLQSFIGKDQGITETILKTEDESSSISYQELFDLCEKSVKDRTDMLVELRGLYPNMESTLRDSLIGFLNAENELSRSKSQAYRKSMNANTNYESYNDATSDRRNGSYLMADYYKKRIYEACKETLDDAKGLKENVQTFYDNFKLLLEKEKSLGELMKDEDLRFTPIFAKYQPSSLKFLNDQNKLADLYMNILNPEYDYMLKNWSL